MVTNYHLDLNFFQNPIEFEDIYMEQLGRCFFKPDSIVTPHLHTNLFELTIVTGGRGVICANGVATPVKHGDIYLTMPCDLHAIYPDKEKPLKFDFFAFSLKNEEYKEQFEIILKDYYSCENRVFNNELIEILISKAIAELSKKGEFSDEMLSALFRQVIIHTIRDFKRLEGNKASTTPNSAESLCYQIMNHIETHIFSLKNLKELEEVTGYSYGYISSLFKSTTKSTISEFYQEKKLEASRKLILEKGNKITEIAALLNYSTVYAFSKAFTKRYGISPREYQKHPNTELFQPKNSE